MRRGSECRHLRGSKKGAGRVGGRRGREIRRRARVCTRWSTASAGRAELIGRVHGAEREREKRDARGNDSAPGEPGPRGRKRGGTHAAKQLAPIGRPQRAEREKEREKEREGEKAVADRRGPPVRRRVRVAWLGRARPVGLLCVFPFIWIF
jgi:hypothetical protein